MYKQISRPTGLQVFAFKSVLLLKRRAPMQGISKKAFEEVPADGIACAHSGILRMVADTSNACETAHLES